MIPRILLVEDNHQNLYLVTFLLENAGFYVTPARSGQEALAHAAEGVFSAIILDIQLPDMDGYTVAQRLRTMPAVASVPIVAVTSYAMPGDRERALAVGCTGYIEKPINPETFAAQIRSHLAGGTSEGEGR
ncbi:TPA: response regulator [Candidatus Acetothermia bacterium]|nr:response regulator [Candidatus Acetothermia bacterium]